MTPSSRPEGQRREHPAPGLRAGAAPLSASYDAVLVDLDGVVYVGPEPVDGAVAALSEARTRDVRIAFVTNNSSRTPQAVTRQLADLGVLARVEEVVTSAQAASRLVRERCGRGARVLAVGGEGLRVALTEVGCVLVDSADDAPAVVVQGFSPGLRYADLAEAALAVGRGAWWVATNADSTLPTARGTQPGNGALVGAVRAAVDRDPVFAGKPDAALFAEAVRRTGSVRPLVVGDRLDTDIAGAMAAGLDSLLVLTGVSTVRDVLRAPRACRPTYLGLDLGALVSAHPDVQRCDRPGGGGGGGGVGCGGWAARVDAGVLLLSGEGADVDLVRAAAVGAWSAADAGSDFTAVSADGTAASAAVRRLGLGGAAAPP